MSTCGVCLNEFDPGIQHQARGHTECVLLENSQDREREIEEMEGRISEAEMKADDWEAQAKEIQKQLDASEGAGGFLLINRLKDVIRDIQEFGG